MDFLKWFLIIELLGWISLPIGFLCLSRLRDRGFCVSKIIAILLISYLSWLLPSLHILPYSQFTILLSVLSVLSISFYLWRVNFIAIRRFLKDNCRLIFYNELIFLGVFLLFLIIRMYNPEIYWGEKSMDFSFLNVIARTRFFPPSEPWFSGASLNYFYFGHLVVVTLAKLTGVPLRVAFNLAIALIPALVATASNGLVYNLTGRKLYGFLGLAFVSLLGNLAGIKELFFNLRSIDFHYFWATSRVIEHTINEYPFWTFLFADLHSHMLVMPIYLLLLIFLLNLIIEKKAKIGSVKNLLIFSLTLGAIATTNSWDYPTYLLLVFIILLVSALKNETRAGTIIFKRLFKGVILPFLILFFSSLILFLPYYINGKFSGRIGVDTSFQVHLGDFLLIFGLFLFIILSYLGLELVRYFKGLIRANARWKVWWLTIIFGFVLSVFLVLGHALVGFLASLVLASIFLLVKKDKQANEIYCLVFILVGSIITLTCEYIYIWDRVNTIFKLYLEAWFFFGIAASFCLYILISRYFLTSFSRLGKFSWVICLLVLFLSTIFCSITGVYAVVNTNRVKTDKPTLDGMNYLKYKNPQELKAINWLNTHIRGTPAILEAQGISYSDYSRISMNTGLPCVLGWDYHLSQRAQPWREIDKRKKAIDIIYNSPDLDMTQEFLQQYQVKLIYVGQLERDTYSQEGLLKFEAYKDIFEPLYKNPEVTIYKVKREALASKIKPTLRSKKKEPKISGNMYFGGMGKMPGEFDQPRDAVCDRDGNIYVVDFGNNRIQKFNPKGKPIASWGGRGRRAGSFRDPCGIAIDRKGDIYVADTWNHRIQKFKENGKFLYSWSNNFYGPRGIACDRRGNTFVTDTGNHRIMKFNKEGEVLATWGRKGSQDGDFIEPMGIALDKDNQVYICDVGNSRIQVFSSTGKFLRKWPIEDWGIIARNEPYCEILGKYLYVTCPPRNCLYKFDKYGKLIAKFERSYSGKIDWPTGLAVDKKKGLIYVIETAGNRIQKIKAKSKSKQKMRSKENED